MFFGWRRLSREVDTATDFAYDEFLKYDGEKPEDSEDFFVVGEQLGGRVKKGIREIIGNSDYSIGGTAVDKKILEEVNSVVEDRDEKVLNKVVGILKVLDSTGLLASVENEKELGVYPNLKGLAKKYKITDNWEKIRGELNMKEDNICIVDNVYKEYKESEESIDKKGYFISLDGENTEEKTSGDSILKLDTSSKPPLLDSILKDYEKEIFVLPDQSWTILPNKLSLDDADDLPSPDTKLYLYFPIEEKLKDAVGGLKKELKDLAAESEAGDGGVDEAAPEPEPELSPEEERALLQEEQDQLLASVEKDHQDLRAQTAKKKEDQKRKLEERMAKMQEAARKAGRVQKAQALREAALRKQTKEQAANLNKMELPKDHTSSSKEDLRENIAQYEEDINSFNSRIDKTTNAGLKAALKKMKKEKQKLLADTRLLLALKEGDEEP